MPQSPEMTILSIDELNKLTRSTRHVNSAESSAVSLGELQQQWTQLLTTVHHGSLPDKHITSTCNAMSFVLRGQANSKELQNRSFVLSTDVWTQAFEAARAAFTAGKTKPGMQILETLDYLAHQQDAEETMRSAVSDAVANMLETVFTQSPKKSLKISCNVLYFFLRKLCDMMSFADVVTRVFQQHQAIFVHHCHVSNIDWNHVSLNGSTQWYALLLALLMVMRLAESKSATLKLLTMLCDGMCPGTTGLDMVGIMDECLRLYTASDDKAMEDISRDVLPAILTSPDKFEALLQRQATSVMTESGINVFLELLLFGKKKSFINESSLPIHLHSIWLRQVSVTNGESSYTVFGKLLSHHSPLIRLKTLDLLTATTSTKVIIPPQSLQCLIQALPALHDDTDSYQRGEILAIMVRLLMRLSKFEDYHHRYPHDVSKNADILPAVQAGQVFRQDLFSFLRHEIMPHLPYARIILALDMITAMVSNASSRSTINTDDYSLKFGSLSPRLWRLVTNPYEDIRAASSSLLSIIQRQRMDTVISSESFLESNANLQTMNRIAAATNRADHADALGRTIDLFQIQQPNPDEDLKTMVQKLSIFITSFVNNLEDFDVETQYPLHGNILGLVYIIRRRGKLMPESLMVEIQSSLVTVCWAIWILCQPHLCVDSPEMETEGLDDGSSGPKDLLAYAWRALRDSSLLMQAMIEAFPANETLMKSIGDLSFDQLARLRHRGAFSTVAQTFLQCCHKYRSASATSSGKLIETWYSLALKEIEVQADRLTRRSAGIPAMLAALIDPANEGMFHSCFNDLTCVATKSVVSAETRQPEDKLSLPQVHGLNCLKDIMTSSRFRTLTEPLVVDTLDIASKSMDSEIWAIKNCGLMLMRASIQRLDPETTIRSAEADISVGNTSQKRPFDIAAQLLGHLTETFMQEARIDPFSRSLGKTEAEFAGLDLLGRLYIRKHERKLAIQLVLGKLSHQLWHIRAQAARLLPSMIQPEDLPSMLTNVIQQVIDTKSVNQAHGLLFAARNLLERLGARLEWTQIQSNILLQLAQLSNISIVTRDAIVSAAFLELVIEFWRQSTEETSIRLRAQELLQTLRVAQGQVSACSPRALCDRATCVLDALTQMSIEEERKYQSSGLASADDDHAEHLIESTPYMSPSITVSRLLEAKSRRTLSSAMHAFASTTGFDTSQITTEQYKTLIGLVNFNIPLSRVDLCAQLKFFACLYNYAPKMESGCQALMTKQISAFCVQLRFAVNEQIDVSTREAALQAIGWLVSIDNESHMLRHGALEAEPFEIYSMLYDLLNDDDDNIREQASRLEARLQHSSPNDRDLPCARRAREQIRNLMCSMVDKSSELPFVESIRRVLAEEMTVWRPNLPALLSQQLKINTVQAQLTKMLDDASVLFAEEKQNLYIDEVAEIQVWAQVWHQCRDTDSLAELKKDLEYWCRMGLSALNQLLSNSSESERLVNNIDLDLLIVRVVTICHMLGIRGHLLIEVQQRCEHLLLSQRVDVDSLFAA